MIIAQEILAAKSEELHETVDQLLAIVAEGIQCKTPIHEIESKAFNTLLQAGRATVQLLIDCLGDGDQGPQYQLPDGKMLQRSEQPQTRPYVSIFGPMHVERFVYAPRQGQKIEFAELDARLALPETKFSYLLQDWDQNFSMEQLSLRSPCSKYIRSCRIGIRTSAWSNRSPKSVKPWRGSWAYSSTSIRWSG
jgi:hypothetical protein